jgi:hypothetical protein
MKKLTKFVAAGLATTVLLGAFGLTACDNGDGGNDNNDNSASDKVTISSATSYDFEKEYFYDDYNTSAANSSIDGESKVFDSKDNIVFESVTYDRLLDILESEGNYLILFGGAWCHNTRAAARYINKYAAQYNISTIYNYDFQLDGRELNSGNTYNSRVSDAAAGATKNAGQEYNYLYGELVNHYLTNVDDWVEVTSSASGAITYTNPHTDDLTNDATTTTVAKIQVPFLFLYNKDNTVKYEYDRTNHEVKTSSDGVSGTKYPIVYGFEEMIDHTVVNGTDKFYDGNSGLQTELTFNYEEKLDAFFKLVKDKTFAKYTDSDFIRYEYNAKSGKTLFAANDKINYHTLTYRQLTWLLKNEGNALILFGGSWCGNTQAVIATINDYAVANNVTVYNFDTKLYSPSTAVRTTSYGNAAHIRESNSTLTPLYANLINYYLTNIKTLYDKTAEESNKSISYTENGNTVKINKLQVPYFLAYNKDAKDDQGFAAPIVGYYEQMLVLNSTSDSYVYTAANYAAYKTGAKAVIQAYLTQLGTTTAAEITVDRSAS